jgi:hypothetical protein
MAMQKWLNVVLSNEVLIQDDEVVLFVESDFGYSPVLRMKQPATGVRRKMLKQFAPPPDDTPELQAARPTAKMLYLGTMDSSHKVDRVVKARRGTSIDIFAMFISMFATARTNCLKALVWQKPISV